jgi:hypothetical protein
LASELCQTVGDEFFFTLHSFLEVGKTQDLPSKFWQTLGDALIFVSWDVWNGGVNVDANERGRAGPTTNLLQFATF